MAGDYRIGLQYPDVEFLGGTQTRPVMAVGVFTNPHNVYFEMRIPKTDYKAATVATYAEQYAANIEVAFQNPNVADIVWFQDQRADGYLVDMATVYVTSDSGNSTGTLDVLFGQLDLRYLDPKITALVATLNQAEAL